MTEALATTPAGADDTIVLSDEIRQKLTTDPKRGQTPKGTVKLTESQRAALLVRATEADVELKPTGEIYMPGVFYRTVLQQVFGPGAWHVEPGTAYMNLQDDAYKSTLYLQVRLIVGRCTRCQRSAAACDCGAATEEICIAEDVGAQAYHPTNARLSYDDAYTAAVTNGLMRCCSKTLGVYANCWEPRWAEEARWQIGLQVSVTGWDNKVKNQWRRWDRRPLAGERGIAHGSPNAGKFAAVTAAKSDAPPRTGSTPQAARPATVVAAAKVIGEKIGGIRKDASDGESWIVTTNVGEHVTDSEHFVRELERLKAQGKLLVFEDELVPGRKGMRKKIISWETAK